MPRPQHARWFKMARYAQFTNLQAANVAQVVRIMLCRFHAFPGEVNASALARETAKRCAEQAQSQPSRASPWKWIANSLFKKVQHIKYTQYNVIIHNIYNIKHTYIYIYYIRIYNILAYVVYYYDDYLVTMFV